MTQYLGICLVVLVIGLVLAVLARLMTGGILEEIEKIRQKRFERRLKMFMAGLDSVTRAMKKYLVTIKGIVSEEEKCRNELKMKTDEMTEVAKKAINETLKTELK